jgi:peroxiredoxin
VSGLWIVAFAALFGTVALLALAFLGTLRRISVVLERAEAQLRATPGPGPGGLEPGSEIPDFSGITSDGSPFTRSNVLGKPSVMVFLSNNCPACRVLERDLQTDPSVLDGRVIAVVSDLEDAERLAAVVPELEVVVQDERSIASAFSSNATPHAFAIDAGGVVVSSGRPNTVDSLNRLISEAEGGDRTTDTDVVVTA